MIPPHAVDKMKQAAIYLSGDGERLNVLGDAQTIKVDGRITNGAFAVIEQNNAPGARVPLHVHTREDEAFYVCDGDVTFQVGEIEIFAPTGTTVYLPRGVPHGFRVHKQTRALLYLCPAGAEEMFRQLSQLPAEPIDMATAGEICAKFGVYFL